MSIQISYKKQATLGLLLVLVFLGSLELIVRIAEFFEPPNCSFIHNDAFNKIDYFLKRQLCSDVNQLVYEEDQIRLISPNQHFSTININSYGFRGQEIKIEKPANTVRIFLVGGSTTFGAGSTSDLNTVPGYLQKEFDKKKLSFNVEVVNAGVPGSHSLWETYYVKNYLLKFQPDILIAYDGWNDVGGLGLNAKIEDHKDTISKFEFKFKNFPFYRTPFFINYHFLRHYQTPPQVIDKTNSDDSNKIVESWTNNWKDICNLENKYGYKTILIVQASARSGTKTLTDNEELVSKTDQVFLDRLNAMAKQLPILNNCYKTVDLRNVFDDTKEAVFYDLVHTNDLGNEIIAKKIFEIVYPSVLENSSAYFKTKN